eukprot:TRINITY_DN4752_c0_g1_i1.p1 TRINITY_DN4752_c0_g1~~TRINITY_DN4752_c0_g1_i1.p1  ORF type:complete len:326 (+),score=73.99 TRINITY_DN4752_c0_g1_i1:159-1136(+)
MRTTENETLKNNNNNNNNNNNDNNKDNNEKNKKVKILPKFLVSFVSGGIAGTFAKSSIAPLERVKILFQIRSQHYPYSGVLSTLNAIHKREGFASLWKGNWATVVRIFPYAAIQFTSFENYRKFLHKRIEGHKTLVNLVSGSLAGATSVLFTYPLDVVRVRLAVTVTSNEYRGIAHCISDIIKQNGVSGLFRGIYPTFMGILPYAGVNFASYEALKGIVKNGKKGAELTIPENLLCGGIAGAVGQTVAYPLDVVRRQMQTAGLKDAHGFNHKNTLSALKTIVEKEGWRGLFRGLSINYLRVGPQVAISFTTYDTVKKFLVQYQKP